MSWRDRFTCEVRSSKKRGSEFIEVHQTFREELTEHLEEVTGQSREVWDQSSTDCLAQTADQIAREQMNAGRVYCSDCGGYYLPHEH